MKKTSKIILAAVAIVVIALSLMGYMNQEKPDLVSQGATEIESLTQVQENLLIEKIGEDAYKSGHFQYYSYVGAHKNLFEVKDELNLTVVKVSLVYVKQDDEIVMVFTPELEFVSLLDGEIQVLDAPEYDFDENGVMITSRIRHEVVSEGETYNKIQNVALLIKLD